MCRSRRALGARKGWRVGSGLGGVVLCCPLFIVYVVCCVFVCVTVCGSCAGFLPCVTLGVFWGR